MKFLFWNTHKNKDIDQAICDIIWENSINIVALAEYPNDGNDLRKRLESNAVYMSQYLSPGCEKIFMLGDVPGVEPGFHDDRFTIHIINDKYIFCAVHLTSNIYSGSSDDRKIEIQDIVEQLNLIEKKLDSKNSIIVGDFNEDPYDDGCLSANMLHGLPFAGRENRTVQRKVFNTFYNPMWNFFGDFTLPQGTYYYNGAVNKNSLWHIYDQVMIRPALKEQFIESSLKIVTRTGVKSLLDKNDRPNKQYSDHLPIIFEIREDN